MRDRIMDAFESNEKKPTIANGKPIVFCEDLCALSDFELRTILNFIHELLQERQGNMELSEQEEKLYLLN